MRELSRSFIDLVQLLNDGSYHDDTSIGEQLGISRDSVSKAIKKLEQYGVPLVSTKDTGYQLTEPLLLLDPVSIKENLQTDATIHVLEKSGSTNDAIKEFITAGDGPVVCLAEKQTSGRGRLSRNWYSPFAENIYLSLAYQVEKNVGELGGLSLVVGLAVANALEEFVLDSAVKLKWPNDIYINDAKLGGILLEIRAESNGVSELIIGIGLNVNMQGAEEIDREWTSLRLINNRYIDRNIICAKVIDAVIKYLNSYVANGMDEYLKEWSARDYLLNRNIKVNSSNKVYAGVCKGISSQGHLLLRDASGDIRLFSSGNASIVKI